MDQLQKSKESNETKGQLIELNIDLVERAIHQVRAAIATQIDWEQIGELLAEAQEGGDEVACAIKELKLKTNQIVMLLAEPAWGDDSDDRIDLYANQ